MLSNRLMFNITRRLANQLTRKITENLKSFSNTPQNTQQIQEHQCNIGCDCKLDKKYQQIEKEKLEKLERFYKSIQYVPNEFVNRNLYFNQDGVGYVK